MANPAIDSNADAVLADYMRRSDAGETIDREAFVAAHPQVAEELREYFASVDDVERMAGPPLASTVQNGIKAAETHVSSVGDSVSEKPARQTQSANFTSADTLPETFGRYRIEKQLGRGAMGAVYLAQDTQLDRRVALKTPTFDTDADADMVERFYREARAAANLRHAGICPIFDVGKIDDTHYISMAYIEGKPMSALVDVDKPIPIRSVVSLVRKIALALDHAHSQGVIHRDLKPANIMIDKQKQPLIMDFGLARRVDKHEQTRLTQDGMILGTPAYMSPEQVQGDLESGKQSDVYSLGVILYELLTGDLPFQGTVAAVIGQIMTQDAPAPSSERAEIDPALDAICQKMMARKIEDRYAGTKEAAEALTGYLKGKANRSPASSRSRASQTPATQTVTADEGLAAFLETASKDEFPAVKTRRDGTLTQLVAPWKKLPSRAKVSVTSALAGMLLVMSVVFMLRTPEGTVRVEVLGDEEVEVLIDGQSIKLTDGEWSDKRKADKHTLSLEVGGQQIPFDAASKTFRLADGSVSVNIAGVVITGGKFQVVRGDKTEIVLEVIRPSKPKPLVPPLAGTGSLKLVRQIDEVRLQGPDAGVYDRFALEFQPTDDGALRIAHSMTPDGTLEIRDAATGKVVPGLDGLPEQISSAAFSRDGSQLIVGTEGQQAEVSLWSLTGDKPARVFGVFVEGTVTKVQFDASGHVVAVHGTKKQLHVSQFDRGDGKLLASFQDKTGTGYSSAVAAVNPAGTTVLHHYKNEWRAVRHDLASGAAIPGDLPEHKVMWMAYSPAGNYLATWGYDGSAVVADANSGKELWRLENFRSLSAAAFSLDDLYLVTAEYASRRAGAKVSVWDLQSGKKISEARIPVLQDLDFTKIQPHLLRERGVFSREIAFAPDGRHFALAAAGAPLTLWKIEEPEPKATPSSTDVPELVSKFDHEATTRKQCYLSHLSADAARVAYRMQWKASMQMFETTSRKVVPLPELLQTAMTMDDNADGSLLATGHTDGTVRLWNSRTLEPVGQPFVATAGFFVRWVSLSDDGKTLLALPSGQPPKFYAWDIKSRESITEPFVLGDDNKVKGVHAAASSDNLLLAVAYYEKDEDSKHFVQLWDVKNGRARETQFEPNQGGLSTIYGIDLSPRGDRLAIASKNGSCFVFDTATGKQTMTALHGGRVFSARFSPDGRQLATCGGPADSEDMHLWDLETGEELVRWKLPRDAKSVRTDQYGAQTSFLVYSRDGSRLLTSGVNTPVCVWKLKEHRLSNEWTDLLAEIDPEDAAKRGWAKTDDGWRVTTEKAIDVLAFERRPTGSYELHATARFRQVTASGGVSGNVFNLPVAHKAVSLRLNGTELSLRLIDPKLTGQPPRVADLRKIGKIEENRAYRFDFLVEPVGDEVRIRVDVNSQRVINWRGPIASLSSPDNTWSRLASDGDENALGLFAHPGGTRLDSFRLRKIGGGTMISTDNPPIAKAPFNTEQAKQHQQAWADHLSLPVEKTVALPGGAKMSFVLIPPGEFLMGSDKAEQVKFQKASAATGKTWAVRRIASEGPTHRVRIRQPFYLAKFETTQQQWEAVMGTAPENYNGKPPMPVQQADWNAIPPLLEKLNESHRPLGMQFILPTEAQWEHACRAGTTTYWHCGNDEVELKKYAWFSANSKRRPQPVGELLPNPFGLYDMHGNAWEWCADWYTSNYYSASPKDDPAGPPKGADHVRRGGSRAQEAGHSRSAHRRDISSRNRDSIGFRLAMAIDVDKLRKQPLDVADKSRSLFTHPGGYFIQGRDKDWFQKWDDGKQPPNLFLEIDRTAEYIELRHRLVRVAFRLYGDRSEIKDERKGDTRFVKRYDGEWVTPAPVKDDERAIWVQPHGYFLRGEGKDWFESWGDGKKEPNLFTEVQRTDEFVELKHRSLPVTFRLHSDKAVAKNAIRKETDFVLRYNGAWQQPESSATAAPQLSPVPTTRPTPPAVTENWTDLFNGKDLAGWQQMKSSGSQDDVHRPTTGDWVVQDGQILCNSSNSGWLKSARQFDNFELELEFKLSQLGNSGVYIRSSGSGRLSQTGVEAQVIDDTAAKFKLTSKNRTGAIHNVVGPSTSALRPIGEWNTMSIRCEGDLIQITLNSVVTAKRNMADDSALRGRPRAGYLGLSNWHGEGRGTAFRNIRIRELDKAASTSGPSSPMPQPKTAQQLKKLETAIFPWLVWVQAEGDKRKPIAVATAKGVCCVYPGEFKNVEISSLDQTQKVAGTVGSRGPFPFCWIDPAMPRAGGMPLAAAGSHRRAQPGLIVMRENGKPVLQTGTVNADGTFTPMKPYNPPNQGVAAPGPIFNTNGQCLGYGVRSKRGSPIKIYPLQRQ